VAAGILEAIRLLKEHPEFQDRLRHNEQYLRAGIRALGLDCMNSESPIIPILMPDIDKTFALTRLLHLEGIYVNPVGYPAVSKNRPRLRLNVSANLEQADLDRFLGALERATRQLGIQELFAQQEAPALKPLGT
jgi:glycine C-acetyltransferase